MSQSRRNKRMSQRLRSRELTSKQRQNQMKFIVDLEFENRMLNALAMQKTLINKIRGNIFERYFNWALGINPMLKIMDNREKLQHGLSEDDSSANKGGDGTDKANST